MVEQKAEVSVEIQGCDTCALVVPYSLWERLLDRFVGLLCVGLLSEDARKVNLPALSEQIGVSYRIARSQHLHKCATTHEMGPRPEAFRHSRKFA